MPTAVAEKVDSQIADHKVVVFSKTWCSYSGSVKRFLKPLAGEEDLFVYELDVEEDGDDIQRYLQQKTGQRTVPNVFIKGKHIGGNSEVQSLGKDQVKKLIA